MPSLEVVLSTAVLTAVGLLVAAVWKGGGKFLAALVELARLPAVVDDLVDRLDKLADLAHRVDRLEGRLSITTTTEGSLS